MLSLCHKCFLCLLILVKLEEMRGELPGWGAEISNKPQEECGIFGIYAPAREVARDTYAALFTLQHRGQDSAGIAVSYDGGRIMGTKELGTVEQALRLGESVRGLPAGDIAIGHVRYSTNATKTKEEKLAAAQPLVGHSNGAPLAISHNGHLVNFDELK